MIMPGMRNYTEEEIELVRKSFSGRYRLRDRCYFELALELGLRVSEMLSLTVGQVYQAGKVVNEVSIERKHMKGGKAPKPQEKPEGHKGTCPCNLCKPKRKGPTASGRTLPLFEETKPHVLAWLRRMAEMLHLKDVQEIDPKTPLFLSRVHTKDGRFRAICRETAWRIIKTIARENDLSGIATHSTRKTLAQRGYEHAKAAGVEEPMRFVQKLLGHKSISSTEHYVQSLTTQQAWEMYHRGRKAHAA
jgi:integrase